MLLLGVFLHIVEPLVDNTVDLSPIIFRQHYCLLCWLEAGIAKGVANLTQPELDLIQRILTETPILQNGRLAPVEQVADRREAPMV